MKAILILGQKKAGTTALYEAIASALPDRVDVPKESGILNSATALFATYQAAGKFRGKTLLDATTTYFEGGAFSGQFEQNLRHFDDVTVVITYRDEAARLRSHYRHSVNFDGWHGDAAAFVKDRSYLDHAELGPLLAAVEQLGVAAIHAIPSAHLETAEAVSPLVAELTGRELEVMAEANRFGARPVIPQGVQRVVAHPLVQVALRPLVPNGLRQRIKTSLGRPAEDVAETCFQDPAIGEAAMRIDAANEVALSAGGVQRW